MATIFILFAVQFILIAGVFKLFDITSDEAKIAVGFMWGITMITTMLIGMKPMTFLISRFSENELVQKYEVKHVIDKLKAERNSLDEQLQELKAAAAKKDAEIKTMEQTQQFIPQIKDSIELSAFTISKSGYMVKQEKFTPLMNHPDYIKSLEPIQTFTFVQTVKKAVDEYKNKDKDNWQVFYVGKHINKYSIGINLDKVKYRIDEATGKVSFYKLELSVLHGIALSPEEERALQDAINHTWIINPDERKGTCDIKNDREYSLFKTEYAKQQKYIVAKSIENEANNLCKIGTEGLQSLLKEVYKDKIEFINEDDTLDMYPLIGGMGNNQIAIRLIADLIIALKAIKLYTSNTESLDNALIPEQASA